MIDACLLSSEVVGVERRGGGVKVLLVGGLLLRKIS